MDKNLPRTDSAISARRRLIKGGFALPAALTVASGSALARTSSTCVARDAGQGTMPVFDAANATWLRVLAYTYRKNNGSTRSYWIRQTEIQAVASLAGVAIKNFWITSGQALCVEGGDTPTSGVYAKGTIYSSLPPLTSSAVEGTVRYYAVLVDAGGDIVGISGEYTAAGSMGGAVHQSCWNSFAISK